MSCWYAVDGERLCKIHAVEDRQRIDGTIRLMLPCESQVVPGLGGLFEVHAEAEVGVYLAQALSWSYEEGCYMLSCTPLGESVHPEPSRDGDDYLIMPGVDPIQAYNLIEAKSQCKKGDHIRLDLDTERWDKLGIQLKPKENCGCGDCGEQGCSATADEHVWDFRELFAFHKPFQPIFTDIVMLGHRQRLRVTIDLAMRDEFKTTIIGHIKKRDELTCP